jgi:MoaA/NifB/PqqE/SkfB family radical SAM enzyme
MCEHTYWNEVGRDMTYDEFVYIIGQFPSLKWVGMTGIGTSFLNRDFLRMIEYVKSRKIDVEIYDSFHLLTKDRAKELVRLKVDKIIASIDAATSATYEKIRIQILNR